MYTGQYIILRGLTDLIYIRKAATTLAKHMERITSGSEAKKLVCIIIYCSNLFVSVSHKLSNRQSIHNLAFERFLSQDGIGEKIAKKIDEILSTGQLQKLEKV